VLEKPALLTIPDLSRREIALLAPLVLLTIYYGFHPQPVIDSSAVAIEALIKNYDAALAATKTAALVLP
jgi:NADH-quinone oxidoreductase subunit M